MTATVIDLNRYRKQREKPIGRRASLSRTRSPTGRKPSLGKAELERMRRDALLDGSMISNEHDHLRDEDDEVP